MPLFHKDNSNTNNSAAIAPAYIGTNDQQWNPAPSFVSAPVNTTSMAAPIAGSAFQTFDQIVPVQETTILTQEPGQHRHHHHSHHSKEHHDGHHSHKSGHKHHHGDHEHSHKHHHSHHSKEVLIQQNSFSDVPATFVQTNEPIVETIQRPVIVEEVVRQDTIVEVQPIITRHVEQTQVNHIEKHTYAPAAPLANAQYTNAPIINEVIHPRVITEVTEVIHREVPVIQVQKQEQYSEERVVLPTVHSREVIQGQIQIQDLGVQGVTTSFNDVHLQPYEKLPQPQDRRTFVQAGGDPSLQGSDQSVCYNKNAGTNKAASLY